MQDKLAILIPEATYHVYNHTNGSEKLFLDDGNYEYFLTKYQQYIQPVALTFCYCLMPNHFHFLIRIRPEAEVRSIMLGRKGYSKTLQGFKTLEGLESRNALSLFLSQQFSHLFNGYTQAFNKSIGRKGSLLMHPFKRKRVTDDAYLKKLVQYIHFNPKEAGLCEDLAGWKHSSYNKIMAEKDGFVNTSEVLEWFGDKENFKNMHTLQPSFSEIDEF